MIEERIKKTIRDIPDFPKPGIIFKDIAPILLDWELCNDIVKETAQRFKDTRVDAVCGIESRGFLLGMLLANHWKVPFIMIRKAGKLPGKVVQYSYDLEYGSSVIEMHDDALMGGESVLIHDDLLATGGTAAAAGELVKSLGGKVAGYSFIVELGFLNGKEKIMSVTDHIFSLVHY